MKMTQIENILWHVAEDVLGKLAFMFSYPDDSTGDEEETGEEPVLSYVSFKGPFEGSLLMLVSPMILPELAGNMLGLDDDEKASEEEQFDALKELINVICGNLLPKIAGKQAIFKVGVPEVCKKDANPLADTLAKISLMIEDEKCELGLYVPGRVPPELADLLKNGE